MAGFGWRPVTDPVKIAENARYDMARLRLAPPAVVERTFPYNKDWVDEQNQGAIGACVGFSFSWMKSYYDEELFNAYWLYKRAQAIDNDPDTKDDNDGTYLWAAGDVLRKEGHALYKQGIPDRDYRIESYVWAKSVDDVRTAVHEGTPPVFGIPWFSNFNTPKVKNNELWIGESAYWGSILGGHAIWCCGASDQRQAVALLNTWGAGWAKGGPVWISYNSIKRLFGYQSECLVALDYKTEPTPPPPPPEKDVITLAGVSINGSKWSGTITKQ